MDRVSLLGSAGPSGSDRDTGAAWEAGPGTLGPRELRRWVVGSWSGPVRSVGWGPAAAERHLPRARLIDEGVRIRGGGESRSGPGWRRGEQSCPSLFEVRRVLLFVRRADRPRGGPRGVKCSDQGVFFIFVFFKKKLQKYIFGFRFYSSIPLPPGRGPTARQVGSRDLYVNKNNFFYADVLGGCLPPPCRAVGSRPKYKTPPLPSCPHFVPTRSREGRGREEG